MNYRPTLLQIQRRKIDTLERLLKFAEKQRSETPATLAKLFSEALSSGTGTSMMAAPRTFEIEELRLWLLSGLTALADGKSWQVTSQEIGGFTVDVGRGVIDHTGKALPKLAVLHLLDGEEWRVRRCSYPPCGRVFVARKAGAFCSLRCGQVVRQIRKFDAPRARKLEAVRTAAQMKQEVFAERLLEAECPRGLDYGQHLGEGLEHRLATSQRVICQTLSTDTADLPYTRGQLLFRESLAQRRLRHAGKADAALKKSIKEAS